MSEQDEPKRRQRYTGEFKREAVAQMAGCKNILRLAERLGVRRKFLYQWREQVEQHGAQAFERVSTKHRQAKPDGEVPAADPAAAAILAGLQSKAQERRLAEQQERIAQLERQLGQKQLEVDFLEQTFAHVRGVMGKAGGGGATPSTAASKRNSRAKGNG